MARKKIKEEKLIVVKIEGYVQVKIDVNDYEDIDIDGAPEEDIQDEIKNALENIGYSGEGSEFVGTIEVQPGKKIITTTTVEIVDEDVKSVY